MNEIKLVCFDFDGVFTNGQVFFNNSNIVKYYNVKDGMGIKLLKKKNVKTVVLSGFKENKSTKQICEHLGIDTYILNCKKKENIIFTITEKYNIDIKNVAYIGDDINDIKLLNIVGLSACPNDAHEDCKKNVDYICNKKGGEGCIREFTDYILQKNKNYKNNKNKVMIMDCLLRDGGIINKWDFSNEFVNTYIQVMDKTDINYAELGYISNNKTNENFLSNIKIEQLRKIYNFDNIQNVKFSVMGDYNKFDLSNIPDNNNKNYPVSLIRIAGPVDMLENIEKYIVNIKNKGYEVSINIMNSSHINNTTLDYIVTFFNSLTIKPDFIYFADSFGALFPKDIRRLFTKLKNIKKVKIGFHGHNNLQLALTNSIEAIHTDVNIIDTCVYGMGKGAGNLPLELFLLYINNNHKYYNYNIEYLLEFINDHFNNLIKNYEWRYNSNLAITGSLNSSIRFINNYNALKDLYTNIKKLPLKERIRPNINKKKVCCIIPARYNSERLKGKLLIKINNISVIARTCLQIQRCKNIDSLYVTTDNIDIKNEVEKYNINVIMITSECKNGTQRIFKAYKKININYDLIINVQGDESFVNPTDIDNSIEYHLKHKHYCTCIHAPTYNLNKVQYNSYTKLCLTKNNKILYISRNIIPATKDNNTISNIKYNSVKYNIHLGVYLYSSQALKDINTFSIGYNETLEDIELLRLIENDKNIYSFEVREKYIQINTHNDIKELKKKYTITNYM